MSRMRILAKVRTNPDYKVLAAYLEKIGLSFEVCPPTGKGHPFLRIDLPHSAEPLVFHISCTPMGRVNGDARVCKLRRALAAAGYRLDQA